VSESRTEPIRGWRFWFVLPSVTELGSFDLAGQYGKKPWPTLTRMEAAPHQLPLDATPHDAPKSMCSCGIYARKTREQVERMLLAKLFARRRNTIYAMGQVKLWGHVIVHDSGYRAQYAYPYELTLFGGDERVAQSLRSRYAVDVWR